MTGFDFLGYCHRFPPTVLVWTAEGYNGSQFEQHWPCMAENEWCGEWKFKETDR